MLCGLLVWSTVGAADAQSLGRLNREVVDLEGEAESLVGEELRGSRLRSPTYVEERLIDGELFYRLQDYVRASIIFTDIVDHYSRHPAFPDALFLLGDSLFRAGDYLGSRTRFRELLDRASDRGMAPYVQRALGRLIEVAIHTRDFDGVEGYFQRLSQLPPSEIEAATAYFRAKYLYSRAAPTEELTGDEPAGTMIDQALLEQARQSFESVQSGSPYYPQARYFIGVIHVLRAEFTQAIEAFRRVLRSPLENAEHREISDLTRLALGRLYYETEQLDQAVEAYQNVPRTSASFDVALYEIAWVFIRQGDSVRAERALEVLSVAAPNSPYIPDSKVLRGNLLLRNGRFDDANEVFRQVRRQFGPVRRELDEMIAEHDDPLSYFRGLVRANMASFDVNSILPPLAQRWASIEGDMERALSVLSDLSQARRLIVETTSLVDRLNAALNAPNTVSVFADLRRHREGTTGMRNRVTRVRQRLIRLEAEQQQGGSGRLPEVRSQRRRIERVLGGMPTSEEDFIIRNDAVLGRYQRFERELNELEIELLGLEARLTAAQRFLDDTREQHGEGEGVQAIRTELAQHEAAVLAYRAEIARITQMIQVGRIQVGVGDQRYRRDDRLRDEYNRLVSEERSLMEAQGIRPNREMSGLFDRLSRLEDTLDQHDARIDAVLTERTDEMRAIVEEESGKIEGYRQSLVQLESETEEVVGAITYAGFMNVRSRFYNLVLRADVGRIDVAWQRREEHRSRVDMLTRERNREIQVLDDEFQDIMDTDESSSDEEAAE